MQTCYVEGFGVFDGHWSDSKKTNSTLEIKRAKRTYEVSLNSLSPSVFGKGANW